MTPDPDGGRLEVAGTHNFREVAPGALRPGRLYRSDALHRLTREGRRTLRDLGIGTVIDLRSDLDRRVGGRDRLRGTGVRHLPIPMAGSPLNRDPETIELRGIYHSILTQHRADLGRAVRVIAGSDRPVLVHCTAGKDRTGLVVALVLSALGVDAETVSADYVATQANLAGEWTERIVRKVRRFRVPITDNVIEVLAHSPEPVLRESLEWIETEQGGVGAYLAAAGVDADVLERLRRNLLPGPTPDPTTS